MNIKHEKFCEEYIKHFDGAKAYRAVYEKVDRLKNATSSASRLLNRSDVQQCIQQHVKKLTEAKVADSDEVMSYFTAVMRGDIVLSDRERNKAAEILAKRYGLLDDRGEGEVPIIIDDV